MNPSPRRFFVVSLAACLLFSACTGAEDLDPLPSTAVAADAFLDAFNEGDHETMASMFTSEGATEWPEARLARWLGKRLEEGAIETVIARRSTTPPQPRPTPTEEDGDAPTYGPVPIDYEVAYNSGASPQTVSLDGSFELVFDTADRRWLIDWSPAFVWPGVEGATGFSIQSKLPKRAPIKDRDGRVLATGHAGERQYPFGTLAGSTIGHIKTTTTEDEDTPAGSLVGGSGLEAAFEEQLAGTPTVAWRSLMPPTNRSNGSPPTQENRDRP